MIDELARWNILIPVIGSVLDAGAAVDQFDTDLTEATDNHYNGMLLMFLSGVNKGQAHIIDDYTGGAKNVSFATSDRWTDVPANHDLFAILPNPGAYLQKIFTALAATIAGKIQSFTYNCVSAATAGAVTFATVTAQACKIKSVVVRANAAQTADLTSIAITCGGAAGTTNTLIDAALGIRANIAALDQQVAWEGTETLPVASFMVITLAGTGATAVNLQIDVELEAIATGGYLA